MCRDWRNRFYLAINVPNLPQGSHGDHYYFRALYGDGERVRRDMSVIRFPESAGAPCLICLDALPWLVLAADAPVHAVRAAARIADDLADLGHGDISPEEEKALGPPRLSVVPLGLAILAEERYGRYPFSLPAIHEVNDVWLDALRAGKRALDLVSLKWGAASIFGWGALVESMGEMGESGFGFAAEFTRALTAYYEEVS